MKQSRGGNEKREKEYGEKTSHSTEVQSKQQIVGVRRKRIKKRSDEGKKVFKTQGRRHWTAEDKQWMIRR